MVCHKDETMSVPRAVKVDLSQRLSVSVFGCIYMDIVGTWSEILSWRRMLENHVGALGI